jgi:hypothetical protein
MEFGHEDRRRGGDQGLSVRKSFAGADGKVIFRFEESLQPISAKTYDILHSRLAPAGKR